MKAPSPRPTRLVLLGHPLSHSRSPRFQNAALQAAGIPVTYSLLDTPPAELAGVLEALRREGAAGNVTIPHKEQVRLACAEVSDVAARAGAVNTFWVAGGRLVGDNTDVAGFDGAVRALMDGAPPAGLRVALLGAGGAARGVLAAVERWPGASVVLHNRSRERAERLASEFDVVRDVAATAEDAAAGATLVVNATAAGLRGDDCPLRVDAIDANAAVLDLVYLPDATPLVRAARARGLRAADGREMLLEQGAQAFARWFGVEPDRRVMREALLAP